MATKQATPTRRIRLSFRSADELALAERIAILGRANGRSELLVVYDSPAPRRPPEDGTGIDADVFVL